MNIRDLEYLVALAQHRHFRKAAQACCVSQPTLSGQIRKLEEKLGVVLIERHPKQAMLTYAGELAVAQAQRILLEVNTLKALKQQVKQSLTGALHLGIIPTVAPYLLPHIMTQIKQQFNQLQLYLYESYTKTLLEDLAIGKLDCLIVAQTKETELFASLPLYREVLYAAVPSDHLWAMQSEIELSQLKGQKILTLSEGHCLADHTRDICFIDGEQIEPWFQATSLETLRNMVAAGAGITLMPSLAISEQQRHPESRYSSVNDLSICYLPIAAPQPQRQIMLLYRPSAQNKAHFSQLADCISRHMAKIL